MANNVSLDKQRLKQLKKKFKHAVDFGVKGNCNSTNLKQFDQAIRDHIIAPGTQKIDGSYRGDKVQLHTDPTTGLTVILEPDGKFLSGWKLNPKQLECVLNTGKL
nr:colicin D domain-containing protein [Vibrio neptunius]